MIWSSQFTITIIVCFLYIRLSPYYSLALKWLKGYAWLPCSSHSRLHAVEMRTTALHAYSGTDANLNIVLRKRARHVLHAHHTLFTYMHGIPNTAALTHTQLGLGGSGHQAKRQPIVWTTLKSFHKRKYTHRQTTLPHYERTHSAHCGHNLKLFFFCFACLQTWQEETTGAGGQTERIGNYYKNSKWHC